MLRPRGGLWAWGWERRGTRGSVCSDAPGEENWDVGSRGGGGGVGSIPVSTSNQIHPVLISISFFGAGNSF